MSGMQLPKPIAHKLNGGDKYGTTDPERGS